MHKNPNINHLAQAEQFVSASMPRQAINAARCHGWYNAGVSRATDSTFRHGDTTVRVNANILDALAAQWCDSVNSRRTMIFRMPRTNTKHRALHVHMEEGKLARCRHLQMLIAGKDEDERGYVAIALTDYMAPSPYAYNNPIEQV